MCLVFFFKETATTEIYTYWQTLALHDARPICGLEATLAWSVEAEDGAFVVAARACGLASAEALPAWYGDLMTRCGVERRLPRLQGLRRHHAGGGDAGAGEPADAARPRPHETGRASGRERVCHTCSSRGAPDHKKKKKKK